MMRVSFDTMNENENRSGGSIGSGSARLSATREAVRQDLARFLGEVQADQVLERRSLSTGRAKELLGDHRLAGDTLRFLFSLPGWSTDYPVKAAMVLHPRCPLSLLRILINSLRLADLVQVMASRDIPRAGVRMAADLFGKRLPETALGRKIQLSRIGGRIVHEQLLRDGDPRVLEFLLESPLLTEGDLVKLLRDPQVSGGKVALIAGSSRWRARYQLRLELARHPLTGGEERQGAASGLLFQDLQFLIDDRDLSPEAQKVLYTVLRQRIEDQSDEEQTVLARSKPGRYMVNLLLGGRREPVVLELLQRAVLDQAQYLALANDPLSPAAVLEALARMENIPGGRDAVYGALRGNPVLPDRARAIVGTGNNKEKNGPNR